MANAEASFRDPTLTAFLDSLAAAFAVARREPGVSGVTTKLFAVLEKPVAGKTTAPHRLPVCRHVPMAVNLAQSSSPAVAKLATAFAALEPALAWAVRASGGPNASDNWPDGHANAMIVGPQHSIEQRDDVAVGVSLLAPRVRYPDHRHAPEEAYLLLTPGRFRHGNDDWCEPGAGGTFHNVPDIEHAMASGDVPLLAFWCLLLK